MALENITLAEGIIALEDDNSVFPSDFLSGATGLLAGHIRKVPSGYTTYEVNDMIVFSLNDSSSEFITQDAVKYRIIKADDIRLKYTPPEPPPEV